MSHHYTGRDYVDGGIGGRHAVSWEGDASRVDVIDSVSVKALSDMGMPEQHGSRTVLEGEPLKPGGIVFYAMGMSVGVDDFIAQNLGDGSVRRGAGKVAVPSDLQQPDAFKLLAGSVDIPAAVSKEDVQVGGAAGRADKLLYCPGITVTVRKSNNPHK